MGTFIMILSYQVFIVAKNARIKNAGAKSHAKHLKSPNKLFILSKKF